MVSPRRTSHQSSHCSLSKDVISLVVGCSSTSKDVRDSLVQSLASLSQKRILKLHINLQKHKGDMTLTDYLEILKTIFDKLEAIG